MRKLIMFLLLGACCLLAAFWLADADQAGVAGDVVRVHIMANSDSAVDQAAKLRVRDAVLAQIADEMGHLEDARQAEAWLKRHAQQIADTANGALAGVGRTYQAAAYVGISDFPQREYAGKVYPAGRYTALKLVLGQGEGQNWWCVAFPPLCLNDFTQAEFVQQDMDKLQSLAETKDIPIQFRSAIWEWVLRIMKGEEQQ